MGVNEPANERHVDIIYRSIGMSAGIVFVATTVGLAFSIIRDWADAPWYLWAIGVMTSAIVAGWAVRAAPYAVVVDGRGVRRSGSGGADLEWSDITDVLELQTRQRHLALVNHRGLAGLKGESAAPEKGYGLPEGTVILQAGPDARSAIERYRGQPPRLHVSPGQHSRRDQ